MSGLLLAIWSPLAFVIGNLNDKSGTDIDSKFTKIVAKIIKSVFTKLIAAISGTPVLFYSIFLKC